MKNRITHLLLCLALAAGMLVVSAFAADPIGESELHINGEEAPFNATIYTAGTTHVPFAAAVQALCPDAEVTCSNGKFTATAEDFTITAKVGQKYLVVNDRYLYIPDKVLEGSDGAAMVPVRTLAKALGVEVGWDGKVNLTTGGAPLQKADRPYGEKDVDLIARVIMHEAGNQSLEGKMAVGNVILHRVENREKSYFGNVNTVSAVLNQKGQFPGATNANPNAESIVAAKLVADGADVVPGAYWFNGVNGHVFKFAKRLYVIGNHAFYGKK